MSEEQHEPDDDDLQAALALQMLQTHPIQVLAESASMLVNIAVARMGGLPGAEELRDLDQSRLAIDALAGLEQLISPHLGEAESADFRRDIAQLRLAYVESAQGDGAASASSPPPAPRPPPLAEKPKIWTPGGDV